MKGTQITRGKLGRGNEQAQRRCHVLQFAIDRTGDQLRILGRVCGKALAFVIFQLVHQEADENQQRQCHSHCKRNEIGTDRRRREQARKSGHHACSQHEGSGR